MVKIIENQEGDYVGIYISGKLMIEGHKLFEGGEDRYLGLLKLSEEYNFTSKDISIIGLIDIDNQTLNNNGNFPQKINDFKGEY